MGFSKVEDEPVSFYFLARKLLHYFHLFSHYLPIFFSVLQRIFFLNFSRKYFLQFFYDFSWLNGRIFERIFVLKTQKKKKSRKSVLILNLTSIWRFFFALPIWGYLILRNVDLKTIFRNLGISKVEEEPAFMTLQQLPGAPKHGCVHVRRRAVDIRVISENRGRTIFKDKEQPPATRTL